jgi:hypothetical protein
MFRKNVLPPSCPEHEVRSFGTLVTLFYSGDGESASMKCWKRSTRLYSIKSQKSFGETFFSRICVRSQMFLSFEMLSQYFNSVIKLKTVFLCTIARHPHFLRCSDLTTVRFSNSNLLDGWMIHTQAHFPLVFQFIIISFMKYKKYFSRTSLKGNQTKIIRVYVRS